jgi:hypothetical protein
MNKVLNKDIRSPGDAKFARWQALFSNFDFSVEHIKGTNNSISDFLSREHLQGSCMIISVQLKNGAETLVNIPDFLNWEIYESEWRPHWELRSTKILTQTTQLSYSNLVPEIRPRRASNVLAPIIVRTTQNAVEAQDALTNNFHDIDLIWDIRGNLGNNQQYFCLNRPRLLYHWPERNPEIYFPNSDYNYSSYKELWWNFIQQEEFLTLTKFGNINTATVGRPPL